jgi:ABC-type lipoprotein release transport system permease subunit
MLQLKLALRNLLGAGLRTWLNVAVLSLSYVIIIWHQGIFFGMLRQGTVDVIKDEIAGGQYWHAAYDPFDPLSLDDAHAVLPAVLESLVNAGQAAPMLIRSASIYPQGRMQSVLVRGIDPGQDILGIPTRALADTTHPLPVLVGRRMAAANQLAVDDELTIRWRDAHGVFDAQEGRIVAIMQTNVPTIDSRQIWVPLVTLQKLHGLENQATLVVLRTPPAAPRLVAGWEFKDHNFLLRDIHEVVKSKRLSSAVLYVILLFLALLAVFDTQVLAVFRRRKEIGTLMALGMTRFAVVTLFTCEGLLHGVLAMALAAVYGTPLIVFTARHGIALPVKEDFGFGNLAHLFPYYPAGLIAGTVLVVMLAVTVVSYLPTRKILTLNPTAALKGKQS